MSEKAVQIELTAEQRERLKKATGKDVRAVKLSLEQLEARATPRLIGN
jgi:hypothetical protein